MEKKISIVLDETQLDHIVMALDLVQELAKRPWWVDVQVCQDLEARLLDARAPSWFRKRAPSRRTVWTW